MLCPPHNWLPCGSQFVHCGRCGKVELRTGVPGLALCSEGDRTQTRKRSHKYRTAHKFRILGKKRFDSGQYAKALPVLKRALKAFPKNQSLWQKLVLSASRTGQHDQAVRFAKCGIRHHRYSDWLWRQLGHELTKLDRLGEAEEALSRARRLNPNSNSLWRSLVVLHRKQKNLDKEIDALENLYRLGLANSEDLHQLGFAHYKQRNLGKALAYYRLSAARRTDAVLLFNMGLVFSDAEMSQKTDAADAFHRVLAIQPDFERAKEQLEIVKRRLVPLAERARTAGTGLVPADKWFEFYINPYEAFQIKELRRDEDHDPKAIQRAKKQLLQEIHLNDGKVSWLDDHKLDASRAHKLDDELLDPNKCRYHLFTFQNKPLLRFLTRGEIEHFLFTDGFSSRLTLDLLDKKTGFRELRVTLDLVDEEPGFRAFLSKPFARQYNVVLTRAIERRELPVIEALLNGRRWVEPEDEDICFEGACKHFGELVEQMRSKVTEGRTRKVSLGEIEDFLRRNSLPELFNLLPASFAHYQKDFVAAILSLASACNNEPHCDYELAKSILGLCGRFKYRSAELASRIEKASQVVEANLLQRWCEEKLAAHLEKQMAPAPQPASSGMSANQSLAFEQGNNRKTTQSELWDNIRFTIIGILFISSPFLFALLIFLIAKFGWLGLLVIGSIISTIIICFTDFDSMKTSSSGGDFTQTSNNNSPRRHS